jgi:hypothetical protein
MPLFPPYFFHFPCHALQWQGIFLSHVPLLPFSGIIEISTYIKA